MQKNFHEKLINLLKTDPRCVDNEGELVIAAVINHARKIDPDLVRLLLRDPDIKSQFFDEIDGHYIFNTVTFIDYISDKNFLANSYTRFRNKIGLNIEDKFLRERGEVALVWPYKDCVLEGGQTKDEEKRSEIFFNEILAQDEIDRLFDPKVLTGWKRYSVDGEQKVTEIKRDGNGVIRENLLIKGNNLLALHTLKTQFRGQVKLIYIDPPYNTGNDSFGYNNSFNHSAWLTFMKNRLEVARDLLKADGMIFIHVDDQEMHYLKLVADDIFGRDNFIATVPRKTRSGRSNVPHNMSQDFDWMLIYTKSAAKTDKLFGRTVERKYHKTPDFPDDEWRLSDITVQATIQERPNCNFALVNPRNGQEFPVNPDRCWGVTKDSVDDYLRKGKIVFPGDYDFHDLKTPAMRVFKSEDIGKKAYVSSDFLNQVMDELLKNVVNRKGTDEILKLFGRKAFSYPKNERLMECIIEYTTEEYEIVLDFHLGSGTTAAVAHKMGRQYIGIEQMNYAENIAVERLKKVVGTKVMCEGKLLEEIEYDTGGISKSVNWQGGGDFVYCELMPYNQTFMEKIQAAETSDHLVSLWQDIAEDSFLNWYVNAEMPEAAVEDFIAIGQGENGLEKQKKLLAELLDKNQLYVNLSEIEDEDFGASEEDKALNSQFYGEP